MKNKDILMTDIEIIKKEILDDYNGGKIVHKCIYCDNHHGSDPHTWTKIEPPVPNYPNYSSTICDICLEKIYPNIMAKVKK